MERNCASTGFVIAVLLTLTCCAASEGPTFTFPGRCRVTGELKNIHANCGTCLHVKCDKNRDTTTSDRFPFRAVSIIVGAVPKKKVELAWSRNRGDDIWEANNVCNVRSGLKNIGVDRRTRNATSGGALPGRSGERMMRARADQDGVAKFSQFVEDCDTFYWQALVVPGDADCRTSHAVAANEGGCAAGVGGSSYENPPHETGLHAPQCVGNDPRLKYVWAMEDEKPNKSIYYAIENGPSSPDDFRTDQDHPAAPDMTGLETIVAELDFLNLLPASDPQMATKGLQLDPLCPAGGGSALGGGVIPNDYHMPSFGDVTNDNSDDMNVFLHADGRVTYGGGSDYADSGFSELLRAHLPGGGGKPVKAIYCNTDDNCLMIYRDGDIAMVGNDSHANEAFDPTDAGGAAVYYQSIYGKSLIDLLEEQPIVKVAPAGENALVVLMEDGRMYNLAKSTEMSKYISDCTLFGGGHCSDPEHNCFTDIFANYDAFGAIHCSGAMVGWYSAGDLPDALRDTESAEFIAGGGVNIIYMMEYGGLAEMKNGQVYAFQGMRTDDDKINDALRDGGGIKRIGAHSCAEGGADCVEETFVILNNGQGIPIDDNWDTEDFDLADFVGCEVPCVADGFAGCIKADNTLVAYPPTTTKNPHSHVGAGTKFDTAFVANEKKAKRCWGNENEFAIELMDDSLWVLGSESNTDDLDNEADWFAEMVEWTTQPGASKLHGGLKHLSLGDENWTMVWEDGTFVIGETNGKWEPGTGSDNLFFHSYLNEGDKVVCFRHHDDNILAGVLPAGTY